MKSHAIVIVIAVLALAVVYTLGGDAVSAQAARTQESQIGRYQLKVYEIRNRNTPGFLILDTTTGDLWHPDVHGKPERLSTGLPRQ